MPGEAWMQSSSLVKKYQIFSGGIHQDALQRAPAIMILIQLEFNRHYARTDARPCLFIGSRVKQVQRWIIV
jgi:hypothetical protein